MTREQLLRYAQLTGGMFGQSMTSTTGNLFTLDKVYWSGNTYIFVYNVVDYIYSYKHVIKLSTIHAMCKEISDELYSTDPNADLPAVFNMAFKLHQLTQKD